MRFWPIVSRLFSVRHIFALALMIALGAPAYAQYRKLDVFDAEDVVIAYYKTAGEKPNFARWIKEREPYRTTPLALRPEVMQRETERLTAQYDSFDPKKNLIVIQTSAMVKVVQEQDPGNLDEKLTFLSVAFPAGDADYFPYDFMDERYAVIPEDLAKHMKPQLQNEQYPFMKEVLKEGRMMTMLLELRPLRAVTDEPFDLDGTGGGVNKKDGKGQWMFLTDIATLSLWTKTGSMLWEYTAPWYITPIRDSLLNLHQEKKTAE